MPHRADGRPADPTAALRAALSEATHGLRLPLNLIASLAEQLQRVDPTDAPGAARQGQVAAVEQAVRHLGGQIDALLDLANGAEGSATPADAPLRPEAVLQEAFVMLQPQAARRGLTIDVEVPQHPGHRRLRGDANALRQALLHAGSFVLGACGPGPLRLRLLPDADGPPGSGPRARLLRLELEFDSPQPRLHAPSTIDNDVDLLALRRVAARMQGHAGLRGGPAGRGCCWFTAQVQVEPVEPAEVGRQPQAGGASAQAGAPGIADAALSPEAVAERLRQRHAGRRLLVVEDDKVNQMVMLELLGDVGLQADTAEDGQEALEHVASQSYALVAMDLRMPRLDGLGATRAMRAMPALNHMPIVAVTANAFDEDRAACRAAGMNDFVPKPIDVDRLYAVLLNWLDRSPVGAAAAAAVAPARIKPAGPALQDRLAPPGIDAAMLPLLGLEGVDAMGGLSAVGGRVATYLRLLRVFIDAHQHDGTALRQLVHDQQAEAASRLAHRLRGSAATLGLVDVETTAAGLESAIDRGDHGPELSPPSDAVWLALGATVQALRTALES